MTRAPAAPGRLGEAIAPELLADYLDALRAWLRDRRTELDQLDAAALGAGRQGELTSDMTLSMALWKAVRDQHERMWQRWDGGRVLPQDREALSGLIWGRLDESGQQSAAVAVSVPEACRISDALAQQLRVRLGMAESAIDGVGRLAALRAGLERLRDQVGLEPAGLRGASQQRWAELAARLDEVDGRARRGADVGGLLGPLEADLARAERDLIVGNAQRREARHRLTEVRRHHDLLAGRGESLATLAERCRATVSPAPRYAVPDVTGLGPVPNTLAELEAYATRLARVGLALDLAEREYAAALGELDELTDRLTTLEGRAADLGVAATPDVASATRAAHEVLDRRPVPLTLARQLVTTLATWLEHTEESA